MWVCRGAGCGKRGSESRVLRAKIWAGRELTGVEGNQGLGGARGER